MKSDKPVFIKLLLAALLCFLLGSFVASIWLWVSSYSTFIESILSLYNIPDKQTALIVLLTENRFTIIRIVFSLFTVLLGFGIFYIRQNAVTVNQRLSSLFHQLFSVVRSLLHQLRNMKTGELIGFLVLMGAAGFCRIYYVFQFPFHIDEMFSYIFFVDKGFIVSASYYPGPNNHILYTLLCNVCDVIGFSPVWAMRVPSLFFSLVLTIVLFCGLKYYFNYAVALLSTALFTFSFNAIFYAAHGRGYTLLALFFFIAVLAIIKAAETKRNIYWFIYVVASVLAFYTVPVYLFASLPMVVFLFFSARDQIRKIIYVHLGIATGVLMLYSPVIMTSGYGALTGNSWVQAMSFADFFNQLYEHLIITNQWLWQIDLWWIFLLTLLVWTDGNFFMDKIFKKQRWEFISVLLLSIPILMVFALRVLPFPRIWLYLTIFQYLLLANIILGVFEWMGTREKVKRVMAWTVTAFVIFYGYYRTEVYINTELGVYNNFQKFKESVEDLQVDKAFIKDDVYNTFLRYIKLEENNNIQVDTRFDKQVDYDMIIVPLSKKMPVTNAAAYELIYFDEYIYAYAKKTHE